MTSLEMEALGPNGTVVLVPVPLALFGQCTLLRDLYEGRVTGTAAKANERLALQRSSTFPDGVPYALLMEAAEWAESYVMATRKLGETMPPLVEIREAIEQVTAPPFMYEDTARRMSDWERRLLAVPSSVPNQPPSFEDKLRYARERLFPLIHLADWLGIPSLLKLICFIIAQRIAPGLTPAQMRELLDEPNDLTDEEQAEVLKDFYFLKEPPAQAPTVPPPTDTPITPAQ